MNKIPLCVCTISWKHHRHSLLGLVSGLGLDTAHNKCHIKVLAVAIVVSTASFYSIVPSLHPANAQNFFLTVQKNKHRSWLVSAVLTF